METGGDGQEEEQEAVRNGPPKRKLEMAEYPNFMAKRFAAFLPYRDATLQKWYDKTRLTTGKSKKVKKKKPSQKSQSCSCCKRMSNLKSMPMYLEGHVGVMIRCPN